jgi:hypothetical protein
MLSHPLDFFAHNFLSNAANIFIEPLCVKGAGLINSSEFNRYESFAQPVKNGSIAANQRFFAFPEIKLIY